MNVSELLETIEAKIGLMEAQRVDEDRRAVRKEIESHLDEIKECLGLDCDGRPEDAACHENILGEESYLPYPIPYQLLSLSTQRAFHDLRSKGYECYAELLCCQTCALSAIEGNKYVFWHTQDADNALEDGTLMLCWDGNGGEIVETLRAAGLEVEWDGNSGRKIAVRHLQHEIEEVAA